MDTYDYMMRERALVWPEQDGDDASIRPTYYRRDAFLPARRKKGAAKAVQRRDMLDRLGHGHSDYRPLS